MAALLTLIITVIIYFAIGVAAVYVFCRIVTPFVFKIIEFAKSKTNTEYNETVVEAITERLSYYKKMYDTTTSEVMRGEYAQKIKALEDALS